MGRDRPVWEVHFTIDGAGDYVAYVWAEGVTFDTINAAIQAAAEPWVEAIDRYK